MFKNVNLSNQAPTTTATDMMVVPKKTSVSSLASIASSVDNSSPYIRLMTDSERRKRSSESQGSNESFSRNRKVSESPNQAQINEELMMIPQPIPNKSPKLDKKIGKRANLPFASKAKVQNFQKDAGGGSKVFANYTAQIKERSAWVQKTQNQTTNQLLAIPGSASSPVHPVRRGSMNDILGQNRSNTNRETHFL